MPWGFQCSFTDSLFCFSSALIISLDEESVLIETLWVKEVELKGIRNILYTLHGTTSRSTFFMPGSKLKTQSRRGTRYSCDNTQRHLKLLPGWVSCHIPLVPVSRWSRPAALRQGCRPFLHEPLPRHKVTLGMSCSHTGGGHNSWEQNLHLLCLPINTHTQTYTRPLHRASHFAKPFHSHNPI